MEKLSVYKKRIAITQKILLHPDYDEYLDALDVNWSKLVSKIGGLALPIPNKSSIKELFDEIRIDGIILSGGRDFTDWNILKSKTKYTVFEKRDLLEFSILEYAIQNKIPVLGVCRGFQLINNYFGGDLVRVNGHVLNCKHPVILEEKENVDIIPKYVNSYHNYGVSKKKLATCLKPLARDNKNNIEAFKHIKRSIYGVMWHPERECIMIKEDINLLKKVFQL